MPIHTPKKKKILKRKQGKKAPVKKPTKRKGK